MLNRKAFTLIEVLISIALLGLIIVPLFSVVEMMRMSNTNLLHSLEKSQEVTTATKVLFMDIAGSDGKLTITKDEFTRLCINETSNSLYNLSVAKVCWVVLKEKNTLVRSEGNEYHIPLKLEENVEVDQVINQLELFDIYHVEDKVLVLFKQKGENPVSFMVQGITNPVLRVLSNGTQIMRDGRKILRDGTQIFKDGSKILPDGTVIPAVKKKNTKVNTKKGTRKAPSRVRPTRGNL